MLQKETYHPPPDDSANLRCVGHSEVICGARKKYTEASAQQVAAAAAAAERCARY